MYKLENNVEWTENLKNAFKHGITRGKIKYTNDNNQEVVIDYDNGLKSFKLYDEKNVPSQGFIGQATARQVDLELINTININNLENKEFELFLGADYNNQTYYINYGKFIVNQAPENDLTNGIIKITAFDYMIKANIPYVPVVTFPCTLKDVTDDICAQTGLELATLDFANADFIVDSNQFDGKTCREVLCHVGKCAFSWVRIGQDNKLYIDYEIKDLLDFKLAEIDGDTFQQSYTGSNLLNRTACSENKEFIWNNGNLNNKTGAITSDYINVTNLTNIASNYYFFIAFYNSSKTYLGNDTDLRTTGGTVRKTINISNIVSNYSSIAYFKLCFKSANNNSTDMTTVDIMLNTGTTALDYEPYTGNQPAPNPDYPQNIQVVTGNNNIKIENKNLCSSTFEQGSINNSGNLQNATNRIRTIDYINVSPNTTYSFNANTSFSDLQVNYYEYKNDNTLIRIIAAQDLPLTFTTSSNCSKLKFVFRKEDNADFGINDVSNVQLEIGNQATTYIPHQEQNYPIALIGKNRFDKAKEPDYIADAYATELATGIKVNNSIRSSFCRVGYVVGNTHELYNKTIRIATDAILSAGNKSLFIISLASADLTQRTQKVNTPITTNGHVEASYKVVDDDENKVILVQLYANNAVHQTIGTYTEYNNLIITIDNEDMSYESYGGIELCKIGNYKDTIIKKSDGWYVRKELNKKQLTSDLGWSFDFNGAVIRNLDSSVKGTSDVDAVPDILSNYYTKAAQRTLQTSSVDYGIGIREEGNNGFVIRNKDCTSLNSYKIWLNNHNLIIYYPLATPTETKITDTTLINQLDALENIQLYEGKNYIVLEADEGNLTGTYIFDLSESTLTISENTLIDASATVTAEQITIEDYYQDKFKTANEMYGAINRVVYADSNIQGQEEKVEDTDDIAINGVHELTIYDNYFAYTTEKRQQLIQAGTRLFGMKYMPIQQLEMVGLAYLDCNDILEATSPDNNKFPILPLNHIIEYNGAVKDSLTSETNSTTETNYKNTNAPINANSLTEIIVDRAMREIKMIVDQYVNFLHNKSGNNNIFIDGTRDGEGFITKFVIKGNTTYFTEDTITLITSEVVKNEEIAIMTEADDSLLTEAGDVILGEPKTLYVDKVEIVLDDVLRSLVVDNTTYYDELQILQDGTIQIIRRIGVSTNQTLYLLDKEKTTILNQKYIVSSSEKGYYYFVEELDNLDYYAEYIIKNEYSDVYATEAYVNAGLDLKIDTNKLVSELNASADIIKLIGQRLIIQMQNFSLDETGYMSANAGQIAGFTMLQNRFYKDFKMLYTFTPEDVNLLMGYIHDYNSLSNGIENLYDLVYQGELNVLDVVRMIEIIHNEVENTSYIEGTVAIKSNDSNELIEITNNLNIDKTRIGIFTMYSYLVRADVIALTEVQTSGNVEIKGIILDKAKKKISVTDGTNETIILPTGITTPTLTQTSRATDKKDFAKLEKALEEVMNTEIYTYHLKSQNDDDKKHVGFVIGNGSKYSHLITAENDKKEEIGVDPYSMVSVLWKAVQEQQAQIEELKKEIKKLKGE